MLRLEPVALEARPLVRKGLVGDRLLGCLGTLRGLVRDRGKAVARLECAKIGAQETAQEGRHAVSDRIPVTIGLAQHAFDDVSTPDLEHLEIELPACWNAPEQSTLNDVTVHGGVEPIGTQPLRHSSCRSRGD